MNIPNGVGMWSAVGCLAVPFGVWIAQALRQAWMQRQATRARWARAHATLAHRGVVGSRPLTDAEYDQLIEPEGEDKS